MLVSMPPSLVLARDAPSATTLACERPAERHLDPRVGRHHDVPILRLDGALRADRAADDAADDRALGVAADHPAGHGADGRASADLGHVAAIGLAVAQRALERHGRAVDHMALATDLDRCR